MKTQEKYWVMKNGVKNYIQEKKSISMSNKEAAVDYEMEQILADLAMGKSDDSKYYQRMHEMNLGLK